jgi:hypothetical protein
MSLYKENNFVYSGAGVMIIEDYYTKSGKIEPCVLLVKNGASGLFTDFGGGYEKKHKNLKETASKELREESRNLFNVSEKYLKKYVDIPVSSNKSIKNVFYRVYIIKINGISRKYFNYNKNIIDKTHQKGTHVPYSWRETTDITHIPFKNIDFNLLGARGKIILTDIDGNHIQLHGRAKRCIYYSQATMYNIVREKPIAKKKDIKMHKSTSWTNNTYTYHLI